MLDETARSVGNLRLVTVPGVDEALDQLGRAPASLVLIHQAEGEDASEAVRLLRELKSRKRPVATLVLSDRHRAEEALMLLRLGAVDYLSRPLDLNRIAYLINGLTLRARYAAPRPTAPPAEDSAPVRHAVDGEAFLYLKTRTMGRARPAAPPRGGFAPGPPGGGGGGFPFFEAREEGPAEGAGPPRAPGGPPHPAGRRAGPGQAPPGPPDPRPVRPPRRAVPGG